MFLVFHIDNRVLYYLIKPETITFDEVIAAFLETYDIDLCQYQLTFNDIEEEIIEIFDAMDFDYMINQNKGTDDNIHVFAKSRNPPKEEEAKEEVQEQASEQIIETKAPEVELPVHTEESNDIPEEKQKEEPVVKAEKEEVAEEKTLPTVLANDQAELSKLFENLKLKAVDVTNAELNSKIEHLSSKIEHITSLIEQSITQSKNEIKAELMQQNTVAPPQPANVHKNVYCNQCKQMEFAGKRFKCMVCRDYDLCETCERKNNHLHPMVKIDYTADAAEISSIFTMNNLLEKMGGETKHAPKIEFLRQLTANRFTDAFYVQFVSQYSTISLEKFMVEMVKLFK